MKDQIEERSSQLVRNLSSCEKKAWKNSGLNGIRTHDLCDAGAVLYQLNYQANWELVICELVTKISENPYKFELRIWF